jgi:hypothetical protein
MFPVTENVAEAGSYISPSFNGPFEFSPPAINTLPLDSLVAVCPRRSTNIVSLGGNGAFGDISVGFTGAALMAEGVEPRPTIAEALPKSSCADEDVAAKAVAATAIRINSANDRTGLFLSLIVWVSSERTVETTWSGDIRIGKLLRYFADK